MARNLRESPVVKVAAPWPVIWLIVGAVCFLVARLAYWFALTPEAGDSVWLPLWLPSGVALAAVLLLGMRVWPGVLLGVLASDLWVGLPAGAALGTGVGNVLEALTAAYLVRRLVGRAALFASVRGVFSFILAVSVGAAISASLGLASLAAGGLVAGVDVPVLWWQWLFGNIAGAVITAPVLLAWFDLESRPLGWPRALEGGTAVLLALIASDVAFGDRLVSGDSSLPLSFVSLPFLVWSAFRFGARGTSVMATVLSLNVVWNTVQGLGPFIRDSDFQTLVLLQAYIGVISLTGLILSAVIGERERVKRSLQVTLGNLERRIQESTSELRDANRTLEQEVAERIRTETVSRGRSRVLESLATGASLDEILYKLLQETEAAAPGMVCSILLLDDDKVHLRHGSAPSLPDYYCDAVDGLVIGPEVGSCGAAAYTGERIVVDDIAEHPYWSGLKDLALGVGLRACWSEPIKSSEGEVLGAFGIYHRQVRAPQSEELELLASAAHLAGIAIERKKVERRLFQLANFDKLTGLPNRSAFSAALVQALHHGHRRHRQVAMFFIDLDDFKRINDTLGHSVGDELLQQVAGRLRTIVREDDQVARLGGDEFTVLVGEVQGPQQVRQLADKIMAALWRPMVLAGHEIAVTGSIGISIYPDDADDADTLLKYADIAMYRAKRLGGHAVEFFTAEMNAETQQRVHLEGELRKALERSEFELYYQPQWDLAGGALVGVEALLRWNHPRRGLIAAGEFIAAAEDSGLIIPINNWVLEQACRQGAQWRDSDAAVPIIAVNLSPRQFQRQDMIDVMSRILDECGFPAQQLELELTENVLMDNADETVATLRALKRMGLRLAIDDFGTGYSSLAYLKRFPIDKLKIDRSFVLDIANDPDDAAIVAATIALGHSLHRQVIAEGVETEEQLAFLRRQGCDQVQGYYAGHPVPASDMELLLRSARPSLHRPRGEGSLLLPSA